MKNINIFRGVILLKIFIFTYKLHQSLQDTSVDLSSPTAHIQLLTIALLLYFLVVSLGFNNPPNINKQTLVDFLIEPKNIQHIRDTLQHIRIHKQNAFTCFFDTHPDKIKMDGYGEIYFEFFSITIQRQTKTIHFIQTYFKSLPNYRLKGSIVYPRVVIIDFLTKLIEFYEYYDGD